MERGGCIRREAGPNQQNHVNAKTTTDKPKQRKTHTTAPPSQHRFELLRKVDVSKILAIPGSLGMSSENYQKITILDTA